MNTLYLQCVMIELLRLCLNQVPVRKNLSYATGWVIYGARSCGVDLVSFLSTEELLNNYEIRLWIAWRTRSATVLVARSCADYPLRALLALISAV